MPTIAEAMRAKTTATPDTASGSVMRMLKKAVFSMAIDSVQTFHLKDPAEAVGRTAENAIGKAAAAVSSPELLRTEQRWLMDTGCPYDLTKRESIPTDWLDDIYQDEPVVLATANGEIRSVDRRQNQPSIRSLLCC